MSVEPKEDEPSTQSVSAARRIRWGQTCLFILAVVFVDAVTSVFCGRFAAVVYLVAGAVGYRRGGRLVAKMRAGYFVPSLWRRVLAGLVVCLGLAGGAVLMFSHPPSNSKCAWKTCGRALGPGLFVSPFPAPAQTCSYLHMCVNEYPYRPSQRKAVVEQIRGMTGCYEP